MKQIREQLNKLDHYCIDNDLHFYDFRSLYEAIEPNLKPQEKNELKQFLSNPNIKIDDVQNKLNSLQTEALDEYDDDDYDAWQMGNIGRFNKYPDDIWDEPLPFEDDYDLDEAIKGTPNDAGARYYYGNAENSNIINNAVNSSRSNQQSKGRGYDPDANPEGVKKGTNWDPDSNPNGQQSNIGTGDVNRISSVQQQKGRGYDPDANPNGIKRGTNWDPDFNPNGIKKEPIQQSTKKYNSTSSNNTNSEVQQQQQVQSAEPQQTEQPAQNEQPKGPGAGSPNYNELARTGQTHVIGFDQTKNNFGRYKTPNNESLDESLNGIEEKCKQKFDEVQNILIDGVRNGNNCEEIDCANRVRKAFQAVGGRVRIVYNTPTYV